MNSLRGIEVYYPDLRTADERFVSGGRFHSGVIPRVFPVSRDACTAFEQKVDCLAMYVDCALLRFTIDSSVSRRSCERCDL